MVNKCCLIYCKSEANGFSFPKIAMVKESISIDSELHVSLSYCGFHVPLPEWFRKGHACKLTRRSMIENFPSYMREKGEEMNPILQEMNELQHYKKKGRPKYSANMIRYALLLRYTSAQSYRILLEQLPFPSFELLKKLSSGDLDSWKK